MANRRKIGLEKETLAAEYLMTHGVKILKKNFYFSGGEIDLIAQDKEYLCFIEVKYRTSNQYGLPENAVTREKQTRLVVLMSYLFIKKRLHGFKMLLN